jgi:anti-anti-sigma factor
MSIESTWNDGNKTLSIDIGDTFNYSSQSDFKEAYINHEHPGLIVKINMAMTEFMDSAALGMLIQLRKFVESHKGKVVLVRPRDTVMKILKTAQFDRLFRIEA